MGIFEGADVPVGHKGCVCIFIIFPVRQVLVFEKILMKNFDAACIAQVIACLSQQVDLLEFSIVLGFLRVIAIIQRGAFVVSNLEIIVAG